MAKRKFNFNPGPATLPLSVLETVQKNIVELGNSGMSVLEISHRGKEYTPIHESTKALFHEVFGVPDTYEILFLGGGASLQFCMLPMNFLKDRTADYIDTGEWSKKAIKEARLQGSVNVAASTDGMNFNRLPYPEEIKLSENPAYVHITSNNTIFGTQWPAYPEVGNRPLVVDMSSDIMCRPVDVSKFHMIYAGAQKNLGPAGLTIVILRKDWLAEARQDIPTMLAYKTHVDKDSLFNTPPVFQIYVVGLVIQWIKDQGGLVEVEKINRKKTELLYGTMDSMADFYRGTVTDKEHRSWMNVTLRLPSEEMEAEFIKEAASRDLHGLKGHRSVGGIRVSMYNAMPLEGIECLTDFMKEFRKTH